MTDAKVNRAAELRHWFFQKLNPEQRKGFLFAAGIAPQTCDLTQGMQYQAIERLAAALEQPDAVMGEEQGHRFDDHFLIATVSRDGKEVGIDHQTDADWNDVLAAHVGLRDRLNERIAEQEKCPHRSTPIAPVQDDEAARRRFDKGLSGYDYVPGEPGYEAQEAARTVHDDDAEWLRSFARNFAWPNLQFRDRLERIASRLTPSLSPSTEEGVPPE